MLCTQCGKQLAVVDRFCSQCGAPAQIRDDLLAVPPAGPTISATAANSSLASLGTKWLNFWTYAFLPIGALSWILLYFLLETSHYFLLYATFLYLWLAYGLHKRRLWAWQWNWVVVVLSWITGAMPVEFGSAPDFVGKSITRFVVFGLVWMWPNYVYWKKRRGLFHEERRVEPSPR